MHSPISNNHRPIDSLMKVSQNVLQNMAKMKMWHVYSKMSGLISGNDKGPFNRGLTVNGNLKFRIKDP